MSTIDGDAGDGGMTLVEVLIALALVSIIMAMLGSAIWSGHRVIQRTEGIAESTRHDAVLTHMRRSLAALRPIRRPGSAEDAPLLDIQIGKLTFVTEYAPQSQHGGLYVVTWELKTSDSALSSLVERRSVYRPSRMLATTENTAEEIVLLTDVERLDVRFFGSRGAEKSPEWTSDWTSAVRLPQFVEISIGGGTRNVISNEPTTVRIAGHR